MKGQSEKPKLTLIRTGVEAELDLSWQAMHHIAVEAQRRGVTHDKIIETYMEEAAEKVIERECAERGITRDDLFRLYEEQSSTAPKP